MKNKFVSTSCLEYKWSRVPFSNGKIIVWPKGLSIDSSRVVGVHEGRLYRLLKQTTEALVHNDMNPCELWHRIYSHLHYRDFLALSQMVSSVLELQMEHERLCKGCALGKNVNKSFPSSESRSKEILDLIHSDVCGPILMKYLGGYLYYVTFFDELSSNTWIYFMKTKDEVLRKCQEFKV